MKGFIDFMRKGNLVALAVAFVMGAAFAALVASFTANFIAPLLGLFGSESLVDMVWCIKPPEGAEVCAVNADTGIRSGVFIGYGAFLTVLISFLTTAAVLYFFVVRPYEGLEARLKKNKDEDVSPTEVDLLAEIRDALVTKNGGGSSPS